MTAIATGVKTHIGAIGVSAGRHNDCAQSLDHRLQSWLALAADAGMGTGIVTTARLTHATPAATYAHVPNRGWESDASLHVAASEAGCRDIASQFIDFARAQDAPQVVLARGARAFLPAPEGLPGGRGKRKVGPHPFAAWQGPHPWG